MANQSDETFRDRLLSHLPQPGGLAGYRREVAAMLEKNQKRLRLERLIVTAFWVFCVVSVVVYIWFDKSSAATPKGPFLACIFMIWGASEVVKHYINACRIDLMKEIKQLQVQVLELHDLVRGS
jgi:hypothetical protein